MGVKPDKIKVRRGPRGWRSEKSEVKERRNPEIEPSGKGVNISSAERGEEGGPGESDGLGTNQTCTLCVCWCVCDAV